MSLPYMPFYVNDFEGKTSHLTLAEDGAYNRLLRLCWRTPGCSIPNDDTWIMRMARVDEATYKTVVQPIISEFFKVKKGRLYSQKQLEVFGSAKEKHENRVAAGKKGGRPSKSLKNNETDKSNAKVIQKQILSNQNQNQNHLKINNKIDSFKDIRGDVRLDSGSDEAAAWLAWLRTQGRHCPNPLNGFFYFKTKLPPQTSEAS